MGKKGREIVTLDVQELIDNLTQGYADEWMAHYYWMLAAHLVSGPHAPQLAEILKEQSGGELEHANKLAERIIELGGEPPRHFSELTEKARIPPLQMPETTSDIRALIHAVLELERYAIGYYHSLSEKTRHHDAVTHELMEEILADEVKEEENWENLLD